MPASLAQLKDLWRQLKTGQRVAVVCAALATLGFVGLLVSYGSQSEYGVLFSDLKPADAQSIVEKLKTANVPYTLSNGGTTLSVPTARVTELRLEMASAGALSGGHVGFDIFDRTAFGATDFAQQINYQRAIEGELARTLEGMTEIESARVHITPAHESVFSEKDKGAKASVVLHVRQGRELSRERTEAVVSLLSSAVEGLDPNEVSVMDARGRLLSASGNSGAGGGRGAGDAGIFSSHLEARRRYEDETASRVVSLLEPVSGAGHVRADVAADVDFSQIEQTEEKYDPKSAVVRSQQSAQESRNSATPINGGISGARANDPTTATGVTTNGVASSSGDQRVATTTICELDECVKRTVGGGGRLTRLSVSVVVDFKQIEGVATARTPEELKKIQDLVAAAVGLDATRGDQLVVQTIPFTVAVAETGAAPWIERNRELVNTGIKYGAILLAALVLVIFVVRPARKALKAAAAAQPAPALALLSGATATSVAALNAAPASEALPGTQHRELDAAPFAAATQLSEAVPVMRTAGPRTVAELEAEMDARLAHESAPTGDSLRSEAIRKQLAERSQSEPELIAMTIRGWLREPRAQS